MIDFKNLTPQQEKNLSELIEAAQASLIDELLSDKTDKNEKGLLIGDKNHSTNSLIEEEIKPLTPMGIEFIKLHLNVIADVFKKHKKR